MSTPVSEISAVSTSLEAFPAHGIWSPPVTPIKADLSVDTELWLAHLQWLRDAGCHGLALFGTTSEANSFSAEERMRLVEAAVKAGHAPATLMIGNGFCSIPETVTVTRHALEHGCKKVLMLPPFYYKGVSDQGLFDHYSRVIDEVADSTLEIYLYHFPKMSAVPLSVELIARLCEAYPANIAGIKDSSGDWENTHALLTNFPKLAVFPGAESLLLEGLRHGGAGCITATANANPSGIRTVFDTWSSNDEQADQHHDAIFAVRSVFNNYPAIPALKYVLAQNQAAPQWRQVRPPLVALTDVQGEKLMSELAAAGFSFPT